jgi:phage-related protein
MKLMFFATASGKMPVKRYLDKLDNRTLAPTTAALKDLHAHGMSGASVDIRKLDVGLWELKVGPHRVIFTQLGDSQLVLLHAFRKQTQRTPTVELKTARSRLAHLLRSASPQRPSRRRGPRHL